MQESAKARAAATDYIKQRLMLLQPIASVAPPQPVMRNVEQLHLLP